MGKEHFGRTRVDAALSAAQRADARAALKLLEGSGLSLEAAARRAIEGKAAVRRVSMEVCADLFLRTKLVKREHTYDWYEARLRAVRDAFGEREMDSVTRAEFREWVAAMEVTASTRSGYVRAARALWRWAAAQEPPLAGPPPTTGMQASVSSRRRTKGFLTVPEVDAILSEAREWRPALALMIFAGIRIEEIAGKGKPPMTWREVNVVEKTIRVPGECAKIEGQPRLLQGLPDAVWAWLGTPRADGERICPGKSGSATAHVCDLRPGDAGGAGSRGGLAGPRGRPAAAECRLRGHGAEDRG
jgi:integrase